jgi:hypothetical protein
MTDRIFDFGKILLCRLDSGSRRGAHMKSHLTGIHLRKKISAKLRKKRQRTAYQQGKEHAGHACMRDRKGEGVAINLAETVKPRLEPEMNGGHRAEPAAPWRPMPSLLLVLLD